MTMRRVTITIPEDVAQRLETVDNVSLFFTDAVRRQDTQLRTEAMLRAAEGDVPDDVRARVRANLRARLDQARQAPGSAEATGSQAA
jgi:hypothetical protein